MTHGHAVTLPHDHAVSFYDEDAEAVTAVARYVADGLALGERVVVIATEAHRIAIDSALLAHGAVPLDARTTGRYVTLDAAETLARFMVDGVPDPARFVDSVGRVIDQARDDGSTVRAFGEMVALLWEEGNVAGAIALESMWNDLAQDYDFFLLCAYPTTALHSAPLGALNRVCDLHSSVQPPARYRSPSPGTEVPSDDKLSEVFVPVFEAIAAARRLVTDALESWGVDELVWDATVMTSEMATNAVRHGQSSFRVSVCRSGDFVRITVEDVGPGVPQRHEPTVDRSSGRGLMIVDELAHRWGVRPHADGKITWAELVAQPSRDGSTVGGEPGPFSG